MMTGASPLQALTTTTPESAPPTKEAKNFFDLPRELRDDIYDLLRPEKEPRVDGWRWRYKTSDPTLRLVSRQLRTEYDDRTSARGRLLRLEGLEFTPYYYGCNRIWPSPLPQPSGAEVVLDLRESCTCVQYGSCHEKYQCQGIILVLSEHLSLFSRLEDVHVSVKCPCVFFECSRRVVNNLKSLANLPKLTKMDITFSTSKFVGWQSVEEVCVLKTTWSREGGFEHSKQEMDELLKAGLPSRMW